MVEERGEESDVVGGGGGWGVGETYTVGWFSLVREGDFTTVA